MNEHTSIAWRRLDLPGHESAELVRTANGWLLSGVAELTDQAHPARLKYAIACDAEWRTQRCEIRGTIDAWPVTLDVACDAHRKWTANGTSLPAIAGCVDIDLGFTPITNTIPIRRLKLQIGEGAPVLAVWVRFPQLTIEMLDQRYSRLAANRYLYESAGGSFRRELTVDDNGFVLDYPGLWVAQPRMRHDAAC